MWAKWKIYVFTGGNALSQASPKSIMWPFLSLTRTLFHFKSQWRKPLEWICTRASVISWEMISQSFFVSELLSFCNISLASSQYNSLLTVTDVLFSPLNFMTCDIGSLSTWMPIIAGIFFVRESLHYLCLLYHLLSVLHQTLFFYQERSLILWMFLKRTCHMIPVLLLIPFHWLGEAQMDQLNWQWGI